MRCLVGDTKTARLRLIYFSHSSGERHSLRAFWTAPTELRRAAVTLPMGKPSIFIASSRAGLKTARELARHVESFAQPTLWASSGMKVGKPVFESLSEVAARSDFVIFIIAGDDSSGRFGGNRSSGRNNLIFELGFLAGAIGADRTFIVSERGKNPLPSDLSMLPHVQFAPKASSGSRAAFAEVATALRQAIEKLEPRAAKPTDFSSCFISYSWKDKPFATKLHDDLVEIGVRCWLDANDLRAGDQIAEGIDKAIQVQDKLLLVLSKNSVRSEWIKWELRKARELESARGKTVLFPVRLDDSIFVAAKDPEFRRLRNRLIVDFSAWTEKDAYSSAFKLLAQSLAIRASAESGGRT